MWELDLKLMVRVHRRKREGWEVEDSDGDGRSGS